MFEGRTRFFFLLNFCIRLENKYVFVYLYANNWFRILWSYSNVLFVNSTCNIRKWNCHVSINCISLRGKGNYYYYYFLVLISKRESKLCVEDLLVGFLRSNIFKRILLLFSLHSKTNRSSQKLQQNKKILFHRTKVNSRTDWVRS